MKQAALFAAPPQPRIAKSETDRLYSAVLFLRTAGARVYRAGRDTHLVNGQRVSTRELLERAGHW